MSSRCLVTTAIEMTWPKDLPILFLGDWCRLFNRRHVWNKLNAKLVPYHWDDRKKLYADYIHIQELYEEQLKNLAEELNIYHSVNYSIRYWRILIGPWLGTFLPILFDRWCMIENACKNFNVSQVLVLNPPSKKIVPNDMDDFMNLFVRDPWNEAIYGELLKNYTETPIVFVEDKFDENVKSTENDSISPLYQNYYKKFRQQMIKYISCFFKFTVRDYDSFIISSYLPKKWELILQVLLGQFPQVWTLVPTPKAAINSDWRNNAIIDPSVQGFKRIAHSMIRKYIPIIYLEGYELLQERIENLNWPKHPRFIFTSNSYNSDDIFKAWAALKVEGGTLLYIGQHGGSFGVALWNFTEDHQIKISDKWISWGWDDENNSKIKPFGILKNVHLKQSWNPNGYALMVEMTLPQYSYSMYSFPVASQMQSYLNDQFRFVNLLQEKIQKQLLIRLNREDFNWCQKQRWLDMSPNINLEEGKESLSKLIKKSRLYIATYNATTFLESLSLNVPTVIFWDPKFWELREDAIPYFNSLKESGIFHNSPDSAAEMVNRIWDDIPCWWNNSKIQNVRTMFCNRFASTKTNPLITLKKILSLKK